MRKQHLKHKRILWLFIATFFPSIVLAAPTTFRGMAEVFVAGVKGVINILFVSLSVGLAYGVVLYFLNSDNEQKREQIKGYLLWGIIGVTVVFGLWGFVKILCDTLGWCTQVGIPRISPPS